MYPVVYDSNLSQKYYKIYLFKSWDRLLPDTK